jgi:hypothetical protein
MVNHASLRHPFTQVKVHMLAARKDKKLDIRAEKGFA